MCLVRKKKDHREGDLLFMPVAGSSNRFAPHTPNIKQKDRSRGLQSFRYAGIAEMNFGAVGRIHSLYFEASSSRRPKNSSLNCFCTLTACARPFDPLCYTMIKEKTTTMVIFLLCRWRGSNPHGIATNGF